MHTDVTTVYYKTDKQLASFLIYFIPNFFQPVYLKEGRNAVESTLKVVCFQKEAKQEENQKCNYALCTPY